MVQVVRSNNRMGIRSVMAAGRAPPVHAGGSRGGGSVGGGGGGSSPLSTAFGPENESTGGFQVGPFVLSEPHYTQRALEAQGKHAQFDEKTQGVIGAIQDEMGKGASMGQALLNVARSTPDALHTLMLGGHLKDLAGLQQILQPGVGKGSSLHNLGPGQIAVDAQGNKIAENPAQPGTISVIGQDANGNDIYGTQGSRGQTPGIHFMPLNNTTAGAEKAQSTVDKNEAQANKTNAQAADPYAGKPWKITQQDSKFLSAAPQVLHYADVLREFGNDATGLLKGPAQQILAKVLGTNDPALVYNTARSGLERSLMEGNVPSAYKGTMEKYLGTLPKVWQTGRYNTADINQFSSSFRAEANARAALVEHENGGRALPETLREQLRSQGVIAPSYAQESPVKVLGAGPQAVQGMSDEQLHWLSQHVNVLSPPQAATAKQEIMRRAGVTSTPGQAPATPASQQQQQAPAPTSQAAPQGGPAQQTQQMGSQLAPQAAQQPGAAGLSAAAAQVPQGGVDPASLQPDQGEQQRQQQAQQLIQQSRQMVNPTDLGYE